MKQLAMALFTIVAAVTVSACASRHTGAPRAGDAQSTFVQEGVYAICRGAYAHEESLVLQNGAFQHFLRAHGMVGGRSSGTYRLVGGTLVMRVLQEGTPPEGVRQPRTLSYDFVVGTFAGRAVLWRGRATAPRAPADTGRVSPYAALFYRPPEGRVPACEEVLRR